MTPSRDARLPAVALVVCTRNRASRLPALFESLARLHTDHHWELVMVDSASTDDTPAVLAEANNGSALPTRTVRVEQAGLARARNAGISAARAPVIAFMDDDCYPEPDLLDRWLEVFTNEKVGYGGGRIMLHDERDAAVTIRTDAKPWIFRPGDYVRPGVVQGANIALRRAVLEAVGGFTEAIGPGTPFNFEDVDVVARASAAGYTGGYFPGPTVRHHHGRRPGPELDSLLESYDIGRGAYWGTLLKRRGYRRYAIGGLVASLMTKPWPVVKREVQGMKSWLRIDD
ncbi:MAG TPA: glycosyltransferase family A protein [Gemmatimonadales bacterium]|nr:glycosyltransferase family A protein [Gemmatimonadales bacterium]